MIDDLKYQAMAERLACVDGVGGFLKDQGVRLDLRYSGHEFEAHVTNGTWGMTVLHDDAIEAVRLAKIRYESEAVRRWMEGER